MPELWADTASARAVRFVEAVSRNVAQTGADWMAAGFVHGVLNTDNINITGESFDYGPWRFLPVYEPNFTAAYFDQGGRYAYARQPGVLLWNLTRLAECFLPFVEQAELERALGAFHDGLGPAFTRATLRRLGVQSVGNERDAMLVESFWTFMKASKPPFEQVFFDWYGGTLSVGRAARSPIATTYSGPEFEAFRAAMDAHEPASSARLDMPYFAGIKPCTMLIDEVDAMLDRIAVHDDWQSFTDKLAAITAMRTAFGLGPEADEDSRAAGEPSDDGG
jgi:uncharacterized protein YdiU (UPF0061 family)